MPNRKVFLDRAVNVQMVATKEHPGGQIRHFNPGWVELDDEMASHPILSKLIVRDDEGQLDNDERDAVEKHAKAVDKAERELSEARGKVQQKRMEMQDKRTQEYAERESDAIAKGMSFNEPFPDEDTRVYMARTAAPHTHAVPSASMDQRPMTTEAQKKDDDNMPSEEDHKKTQKEDREEQKDSGQPVQPSSASVEHPSTQPSAADSGAVTNTDNPRRAAIGDNTTDATDARSPRVKTRG
jgi:hypothetical protein